MLHRAMAMLLAAFFLGLVGLLAAVGLFLHEPLPVLTPRAPLAFDETRNGSTVAGRVAVDTAMRFEVVVATNAGAGAPEVALVPEAGAAAIEPEFEVLADGRFLATGRFHAPGRWRISLSHGQLDYEVPFILAE